MKSVNKSTLQFKKTRNRRSGSPINWTPRKKTESYMKRKIKHLQVLDELSIWCFSLVMYMSMDFQYFSSAFYCGARLQKCNLNSFAI